MSTEYYNSSVYVITGGCGFLGRHIVKMLLDRDPCVREIRIFDCFIDRYLLNLSTAYTIVTLTKGSVTNREQLDKVVKGAHVVIHVASLIDYTFKYTKDEIMDVNVTGTQNVINSCLDHGVQFLVYTSSMEVIGPNKKGDAFHRGNEETSYPTIHSIPYTKSKDMAEKMVCSINGKPGNGGKELYTCCIRPTGIYGEDDKLLFDFCKKAMAMGRNFMATIPPGVEHSRVYVGNVAWMHLLAARELKTNLKLRGQVYYCYDDSPLMNYEDFNMIFFGLFGITKRMFPSSCARCMAKINDWIRKLVNPVYKYTPVLNCHTLNTACTTFSVKTTKAFDDFTYTPLYCWTECFDRTKSWLQKCVDQE
ncbi:putative dehydrogenase [Namao virus]|nr:putative dehydrogenase [Namao virus]